jgi:hypothetical protein
MFFTMRRVKMKKNVFFVVMLGAVLAFVLVLSGCDNGTTNGGGGGELSAITEATTGRATIDYVDVD